MSTLHDAATSQQTTGNFPASIAAHPYRHFGFPLISLPLCKARARGLSLIVFLGAILFMAAPVDVLAISTSTLITVTGEAAGDGFGFSASNAGDVNGDGFDDLIIGAFENDGGGTDAGRAYVYYGGPGADAVADLTFTGEAAFDLFGSSVSNAGDVNGDGFDDLIIGAFENDGGGTSAGRAYVYYGGPGADAIADLTFTGEAVSDGLGYSVSTAGDVNGDGFDDLVVGAPYNDAGGTNAGRAYVYYGGPGADAVADLTFTGEAAGDQFGTSVSTAGDVNGDGFDDLIVGAIGASAEGRAYVHYGGPGADAVADLTFSGEASLDIFGWSVSTAGDVDGDGFDDLIVGAHFNDAGGTNAGRAYVYYGGPGADAVADLTFTGEAAGDQFGFSVSNAGDVNGDGFDDLIVGAHLNAAGGFEAGRAYVYFGGPGADDVADLTFTGEATRDDFGTSVSTAGDVNGDGLDDLIVGARYNDAGGLNAGHARVYSAFTYHLSPPAHGGWVTNQPATVEWTGHDVADLSLSMDGGLTWSLLRVGVGGDRHNGLTVTAPGQPTRSALLRLTYSGQSPTSSNSVISESPFPVVTPQPEPACRLDLAPVGEAAGEFYGSSVSTAGDVNGDGFDDFIVGAFANDAGGANAGRAYVYYAGPGADAIADLTFTGEAAGDEFGQSVSTAGDFNGDGFDDLIVGAWLNDAGGSGAGRAYVYYGGPGADAVADLTFTGEAAGDGFGISVSNAADVNGDGFDDLIVGASTNDVGGFNAGRVYVYYGGPGADTTADLTLTGEAAGDVFGSSVSTAGDVNGDGFDDVIVGAQNNDAGGTSAGRAYVYYGGPAVDATADIIFTGEAAADVFGSSVSTAGDVNGDGFDDLIVGAYANDAGGFDAGRAYVYYGGPGADTNADLTFTGKAVVDRLGYSVSTAGDVNGDGFDDLIVGAHFNDAGGTGAGRAYVYYGGPAADATADITFTGEAAGDNLGQSVSNAGDVNGDGFDDVVMVANANDFGGTDAGRAYVYDCNRFHVLSPAGGDVWNVGAEEAITWSGAAPADVWLSVDGGSHYQLIGRQKGGNPQNALALTVPHQPTRFARVMLTAADEDAAGDAKSDSLFTIEASIALLNLKAEPIGGGVLLSWDTDPGPEDLAGYKVERSPLGGRVWTLLASLVRETEYLDASGAAGMRYRLTGINGLGDELLLGETSLTPRAALAAWPLPFRGGELNLSFATFGGRGGGRGVAQVAVFDLSGRLVRTIARGDYEAGYQTATWDGRDESGRTVSSGVYFLRAMSAGESHQVKLPVVR